MKKSMRHRIVFAIAGIVSAVALTGCGIVSGETEAKGKEAVCASADASVESLRAGGTGAKAVASLIYDLAEDSKVKDAAKKVRDGEADERTIETLVAWVDKAC